MRVEVQHAPLSWWTMWGDVARGGIRTRDLNCAKFAINLHPCIAVSRLSAPALARVVNRSPKEPRGPSVRKRRHLNLAAAVEFLACNAVIRDLMEVVMMLITMNECMNDRDGHHDHECEIADGAKRHLQQFV